MSLPAEPEPIAPSADAADHSEVLRLRAALIAEGEERQRAQCMASIQSDAVQLALELLVSQPDLRGFFRMFIKRLVEDAEAQACSVWLRDEASGKVDFWMANVGGDTWTANTPGQRAGDTDDSGGGTELQLPRESMIGYLESCRDIHDRIGEYAGDDPRLPEPVRAFNLEHRTELLQIAPMRLAEQTLGWIALSSPLDSACERQWRRALLDATARQATLALYYSRLVERSLLEARRQAVLEERNRIARDIHDTLAQGFGAILMQLQAAQRASDAALAPSVARSLNTAVELARAHLIEARRSVAALRPQPDERIDMPGALQRMVDLARRTSEVAVDLTLDELPVFDPGVEREVIGIAQEALTNATKHARARRIVVTAGAVRGVGFRLSVADDGRGMTADCNKAGFGLTSMRERAERIGGSLTFVTAPRAGTEVVLAWQPAAFSIPRAADGQR